jgi:hypothetical protein
MAVCLRTRRTRQRDRSPCVSYVSLVGVIHCNLSVGAHFLCEFSHCRSSLFVRKGLTIKTVSGSRAPFSGCTTIKASRQRVKHRQTKIQKRRSESRRWGRCWRHLGTTSCCRRRRFSAISASLDVKAAEMAYANNRNIPRSCWSLFSLEFSTRIDLKPGLRIGFCALQRHATYVYLLVSYTS